MSESLEKNPLSTKEQEKIIEAQELIDKLVVPVEEIIPNFDTRGLENIREEGIFSDGISVNLSVAREFLDNRDFRDIFDSEHGVSMSTPWGKDVYDQFQNNKEVKNRITETLRNQIVVELGAGMESYGYEIARESGAKAFIAVEPHYIKRLESSIVSAIRVANSSEQEEEESQESAMKVALVQDDMLHFLMRVPIESISIIILGIDDEILPDPGYRIKVASEILKTLSKKGAVIHQFQTAMPTEDLEEEYFRDKDKVISYGVTIGRKNK